MTDIPGLSSRILANLRELSHLLNDPAYAFHDEWEAAISVRRLIAEWSLEARGFKTP